GPGGCATRRGGDTFAVFGRCNRRRGTFRASNCTRRSGMMLVGAAGFEPARPCGQKVLSLQCLPVPPRPRRPTGSEILDLLVDLADALLPLFLLGERLGLALPLGLFLLLHALVRAADPLVDVLHPGRQVPLVGLEDQGLVHHAQAPRMTEHRGFRGLGEEPRPFARRRGAELDGPGELLTLEVGRLRRTHPLDQLGHEQSPEILSKLVTMSMTWRRRADSNR